MVAHVRGRDLSDDRHARVLLQLVKEVEGHEAGSVEPQHVNVVGLHQPARPVLQPLAHKGHALVQVAQVVEPAIQGHLLIVALALEVTGHAECREAVPGARAGGVPDHLAVGTGVPGRRREVHEVCLGQRFAGEAIAVLAHPALAARPHRLQRPARRLHAHRLGVLVEGLVAYVQGVEVLDLVERVEIRDVFAGVHWADVVHDNVQHEGHVPIVQAVDKILKVLLRAVVRVDLVVVLCPVTHEAGAVLGLPLILLDHWCDPQGVKPHPLDVVQLGGDPLQRAPAPVLLAVARLQLAVCPREAVNHHKVHGLPREHVRPLPPKQPGPRLPRGPTVLRLSCHQAGPGRLQRSPLQQPEAAIAL
mmetsp:Transcript_105738/g.256877  ORF Transcript_105738/g.256877 Transcript_105738/m.256877 type:complete len:361 (-) Transcript_105738:239-1321(-)